MLSEDTIEEAIRLIEHCLDKLGDLDSSIEGWIELLDVASDEITVARNAAKCDLEDDFDRE